MGTINIIFYLLSLFLITMSRHLRHHHLHPAFFISKLSTFLFHRHHYLRPFLFSLLSSKPSPPFFHHHFFLSHNNSKSPNFPKRIWAVKKVTSRSSKADLQFPVGYIALFLKARKYAEGVDTEALVYLAAVLEYLVVEVLELAMNATRDN